MALSSIIRIYRARLRVRRVLVQELLAVLGLAVGVALLFASQVASTSLDHSVSQLSRDLVGNMQLQLQARGPQGFDKQLLSRVRRIPGVEEALPVLEEQADVIGPHGRESVELLGAAPSFAHSGGELLRHFSAEKLAHQQALAPSRCCRSRYRSGPISRARCSARHCRKATSASSSTALWRSRPSAMPNSSAARSVS